MSNRQLKHLLSPIRRAIRLVLSRGVVTAVNAGLKMQGLQIKLYADEVKGGLEHFEPYGFTAHPHSGAEALGGFFAGDRSHGVVITVADRRYRLRELKAGEVAMYDDLDQVVHLTREGIRIYSPMDVTVKADNLARLEGDVVEIHAATKLHFDVNGYGEDWVHDDGAWRVDTWKDGNVVGGSSNPISPPEHEG